MLSDDAKKNIISNAIKYIQKVFDNNSDGHDTDHSLRVYHNALSISSKYQEADLFVISLAAILHDVDDHKLFNTKNNQNARTFLEGQDIQVETIEWIVDIINGVSFSHNKDKVPETLEGKIVQDADRLDAIGAIGIARTFAYGGKHDRSLEDSLKHFDDKLLLLKDLMNTEVAADIASERHAFMEAFLNEYRKEC
jgi:uncharacterized protein